MLDLDIITLHVIKFIYKIGKYILQKHYKIF
jgi:hypothetical protein